MECIASDLEWAGGFNPLGPCVKVDGGMSKNRPFMQLTADIIQSAVERGDPEVGCLAGFLLYCT